MIQTTQSISVRRRIRPSRKIDKAEKSQQYTVLNLTVAYILAKVEAGKDQEVLKEVKMMPGVRQATATYGVYDLHVEVSFETMEELDKFIFDGIRRISGIKETVTLTALRVK
jgi:DNA-binding Lrp family transcriptional regulator